jgi:hypothetical protein
MGYRSLNYHAISNSSYVAKPNCFGCFHTMSTMQYCAEILMESGKQLLMPSALVAWYSLVSNWRISLCHCKSVASPGSFSQWTWLTSQAVHAVPSTHRRPACPAAITLCSEHSVNEFEPNGIGWIYVNEYRPTPRQSVKSFKSWKKINIICRFLSNPCFSFFQWQLQQYPHLIFTFNTRK